MNPSDQARQVGVVDSWLSKFEGSSAATTPSAGQVVLDTGPLPAGYYDVTVFVGVSGGTAWNDVTVDHRNATNTANISSQGVLCAALNTIPFYYRNIQVAASERFRVITPNALLYNVWATILATRRV